MMKIGGGSEKVAKKKSKVPGSGDAKGLLSQPTIKPYIGKKVTYSCDSDIGNRLNE